MKIDIENEEENLYRLIFEDLTMVEITALLHIFERATSTNKRAKEFLESLKEAVDKEFLKN